MHSLAKVYLRRLYKQMMITHQNVCVDTPPGASAAFTKFFEKGNPVLIIEKDCLPSVPRIHEMAISTLIFDSWFPRHFKLNILSNMFLSQEGSELVMPDPDPYFTGEQCAHRESKPSSNPSFWHKRLISQQS